jgi:hypothetical protein
MNTFTPVFYTILGYFLGKNYSDEIEKIAIPIINDDIKNRLK